jgi:very-short-patch-repair endonuclease
VYFVHVNLRDISFAGNSLWADLLLILVCFEKRLVVEVDGGQHNEPLQAANDSERSTWLEQQDFRVLRFWNHEILREIESVKETIARALG